MPKTHDNRNIVPWITSIKDSGSLRSNYKSNLYS